MTATPTKARKILMFAMGSGGDVHPSIGVGKALLERGHEVEIHANPHYEKAVHSAGVAFEGIGSEREYLEAMKDPELWE